MNPDIEQLENLLVNLKNGDENAASSFFDLLSTKGVTLPKTERRGVVNAFYEWSVGLSSLHKKILSLATLAKGMCSFYEEQHEKSLTEIMEAQQLFSELKDEDGVAACHMVLGVNYRTLGDVELALKYLMLSKERLSKPECKRFKIIRIYSVYQLSEIYAESNQLELALSLHKEALKLITEIGSPIMSARSLSSIGIVYLRLKQYALAFENLQEALHVSDEFGIAPIKAKVLTDIGQYYLALEDYNEAIKFHTQAKEMREEQKLVGGAITNMIHLGEIFTKQGKYNEAIEVLKKGLVSSEALSMKQKMYQIHLLLSQIYKSKGDDKESLSHFKAYHDIREIVNHEDGEKKVKNMLMIFEAEQTKKENIIIKAQKAEIEKKNHELQETIDELTRTRVGKKAKAFTLVIAIVLFVAEELVLHFVMHMLPEDNLYLSYGVKAGIIFSLKPIDSTIEHFLLKKIMRDRRKLRTGN